jgi:Uma2 family endonuclease
MTTGELRQVVSLSDDAPWSLPLDALQSLAAFRRWTRSERFPEKGRIDYLNGSIEVDMTPEKLETHGSPKLALAAYLHRTAETDVPGRAFVDSTRVCSEPGGLSAEPDVVFVSLESLKSGRVRMMPAASGPTEDFIELEGPVDVVVELISDGSVEKDTERLPALYAAAGIREYWLVDARGAALDFRVLHLRAGRYVRSRPDAEGFQRSRVLGRSVRFRREPWALPGTWTYRLDERPKRQ